VDGRFDLRALLAELRAAKVQARVDEARQAASRARTPERFLLHEERARLMQRAVLLHVGAARLQRRALAGARERPNSPAPPARRPG
jgi:hypothetical protein